MRKFFDFAPRPLCPIRRDPWHISGGLFKSSRYIYAVLLDLSGVGDLARSLFSHHLPSIVG